jgi:hypothetical protein
MHRQVGVMRGQRLVLLAASRATTLGQMTRSPITTGSVSYGKDSTLVA